MNHHNPNRRYFLTICSLLLVNLLAGQAAVGGNWTWIKGNDKTNVTGFYGQLGVPEEANSPRSRSAALTWTDDKGITWIYGGNSFCGNRCGTYILNDFWTYNPGTNNWTWIAGLDHPDRNIEVVYGQQGVPSPENTPGARSRCFSWVPGDGKFWFYDPQSTEVWNYNPATAQWTWIKGNNTSPNTYYGTRGVAAGANTPGILPKPPCWKDKSGNIWVFGNQSYGDVLWTFDIKTHYWTWIKGDTTAISSPRYGTYRKEDPTNTPASLSDAFTWADNNGDFWGMGYNNEVWKFNFNSKNWVWMKEAGPDYPQTVYGVKGIEDEANIPGERWDGCTWVDQQNNLWFMGGIAYHETLDELWRFNTTTLKWTWVRGGEEATSYGVMGVPSPGNLPPRRSQSTAWSDHSGNFWMMAGLYVPRVGPYMCYNDVWIFTPNGITLALNPLSFHASRVGSDALLNWEYPGEKGIKGYQIQKLDEAATAYKSIGYQASKTTAGQHPIYTYTDLNLSSKATFYRLQLLHTNGDISYSETRHVPGLDQQDNITLFPNPSAGQVVNIRFTGGGVRDISLVDLNGVTRKRWFNYNSSLLQLYNLQPGTYMLQVVNKNNKLVKTRKIVVIK